MNKKLETIIVTALCLFAIYMWTLPIQKDNLPYGEVDAGAHFSLGDYMGQNNKVMLFLPYYIDLRYGGDNSFMPHTIWYPPVYHTNLAIMQIIGGERIIPIYLLVSILSSSVVLIMYIIIKKLYGFWSAILSSFLLVFSMRDILNFLWGQWPERISYYIVPLALYAFYKYCYSCIENEKRKEYIYIAALLFAISFLIHPMGLFYSASAVLVFLVLFLIKEKKWIFNSKEILIAAIIFILIISIFPIQLGNVIMRLNEKNQAENAPLISLFKWSKDPSKYVGAMPEDYFSYSKMHGIWTMPLLIIGLFILLIRRNKEDIFILSWLIAVYIMVHLDVIGKGGFSHRSLSASAHIFSPIIAIGLLSIPKLFKSINKNVYITIKYGLIILFLVLAININGKQAYSQLSGAYSVPLRMTEPQYEVSEWMRSNLDVNADIEDIGTLNLAKKRWIQYVSQRHINHINNFDENITSNYVLLDYSDAFILRNYQGFEQQISEIQTYEKNMSGYPLIYDKNNIRVYKVG